MLKCILNFRSSDILQFLKNKIRKIVILQFLYYVIVYNNNKIKRLNDIINI